jgi:mono/diheme cytochrome c family protein
MIIDLHLAIRSIALLLATSAAMLVSANAMAQPNAAANSPDSDPVFNSWKAHSDVADCGRCHYQASGFGTPDQSFSRQDELQFWLANDKHAIARRRVEPLTTADILEEAQALQTRLGINSIPKDWFGLSNALSYRICEKLGYDVKTPTGYAAFQDNCLTCHGGYQGDGDNANFAKSKDGGKEQPGISCNYCHQIGDKTTWVNQHGGVDAATAWRNLPPNQKAAAGMQDLVNVGTQAANCYDCHIGNRDKNMFVTHVMYAAGHPPLPGIELQTFCESMPRHWRTESELYDSLKEAGFGGRDEYYKVNFPKVTDSATPDEVFWNTRKILVGAIAARLQAAELIADSANNARWADYSLYDCAACHHELREPSARQERGYAAAPGRPRLHEWPNAILSTSLDLAVGPSGPMRESIDATEAKLAVALSQSPFGEPNIVGSIATEQTALLRNAMKLAQSKPISANGARLIIKLLASPPKNGSLQDKLVVYDSARQVVWAIQAVAAELEAMGEPLPPALAAKITSLGDPAISGLDPILPAGRQVFIYPEKLNEDLERRATYSPEKLAALLAEIATDIAKPQAPRGNG